MILIKKVTSIILDNVSKYVLSAKLYKFLPYLTLSFNVKEKRWCFSNQTEQGVSKLLGKTLRVDRTRNTIQCMFATQAVKLNRMLSGCAPICLCRQPCLLQIASK